MTEIQFKNGSYIRAIHTDNEPTRSRKSSHVDIYDEYYINNEMVKSVVSPFIKNQEEKDMFIINDKECSLTINSSEGTLVGALLAAYEKEANNTKILAYEVPGMKITCEEIFVNKTKHVYLNFKGEGDILGRKKTFNKEIHVDTDIYNRYDWRVSMGVLYVTLFEKINERPDFSRIEKKVTTNE